MGERSALHSQQFTLAIYRELGTVQLMSKSRVSVRQLVGITLWWAEGSKSRRDKRWKNAVSYPIEVTNTDPRVLKTFLDFLRNDIGVDEGKLKVQIQIHADNNLRESERYWSKITGVPVSRFHKTIVRPLGKKHGRTRGTCKVRYTSKAVYLKLQTLFESVLNEL